MDKPPHCRQSAFGVDRSLYVGDDSSVLGRARGDTSWHATSVANEVGKCISGDTELHYTQDSSMPDFVLLVQG